jgi:putative MATE family efflux protein
MGIFRGLQNTYWPMLIALVGASLNIILDFILVYGIADILEPMYLEGAAWASLCAQAVMAIMSFILLARKTDISLKIQFPLNPEFSRLVGMTFNLFVRTVALNLTLILAVREATTLGDQYIGAHTIAINLWLFAAFFIDGYGAAGNIMGGRLLGAKDYEGLWNLMKKICLYGVMVSVVLLVSGFIFYRPLGDLFSNDQIVLDTFNSMFYLVMLALPLNAIAFVLDGLFKGLGEMRFLRNVLIAATGLGFVPSLFLGKYLDWGLHGVWIAITVWMLIRGLALLWKFNQKFRPLLQKG